MKYKSTRGGVRDVSFSEVVRIGLAPDGGLFVPEEKIHFDSVDLASMCAMSYISLAKEIISRFATDFTSDEINDCVQRAYSADSFPEFIAPISKLSNTLSVLELWHGPTSAFKDMALQILPQFMTYSMKKIDDPSDIVILTATSGDTGKAALEGFKDVEGIKVMVFYPENGVSEMQKYQMITQRGNNVSVVAVRGNFDDAQSGVKAIFRDKQTAYALEQNGQKFSSANSINWGRLLPQIVYYFHSYFTLVRADEIKFGAKINFAVPTGNFGNILAAYYAMKLGLPIGKIICAANKNNVVPEFMATGTYDKKNREFLTTISPAMDILISSNLERLIYDMSGEDDLMVSNVMKALREDGIYSVDKKTINNINASFWSSFATEAETMETIRNIYNQYNYLIDPHTAVGINVYDKYVISTGDLTKTIAVSTASPFKFNKSVTEAIFGAEAIKNLSEFEILDLLSEKTGKEIPEPLRDLNKKEIRHNRVCNIEDMKKEVEYFTCLK